MARIMITAMPFTGHVAPLCAVAAELVGRGHRVRFYTGGAFRDRVEASGAAFVPWRAAPDFDENDLSATFPRLIGKKGFGQLFINLEDVMIDTAPAQVTDLEEEQAREPWDTLVAEETSVGAALFAERSGCPHATVAVLPLNISGTQGPPSGIGLTPGRTVVTRARDAALRAAVPVLPDAKASRHAEPPVPTSGAEPRRSSSGAQRRVLRPHPRTRGLVSIRPPVAGYSTGGVQERALLAAFAHHGGPRQGPWNAESCAARAPELRAGGASRRR